MLQRCIKFIEIFQTLSSEFYSKFILTRNKQRGFSTSQPYWNLNQKLVDILDFRVARRIYIYATAIMRFTFYITSYNILLSLSIILHNFVIIISRYVLRCPEIPRMSLKARRKFNYVYRVSRRLLISEHIYSAGKIQVRNIGFSGFISPK